METKVEELKTLDTDRLLELKDRIDEVLTDRRQQLEAQLARMAGRAAANRILPRYRSKEDPTITWSGRGVLPKWMREEIKGTELSKEDFRIS